MTDKNVYQCIADVSGDIAKEGIAKTRKNEQQGYKFRGIDEVYNALAPLLSKHGLVILPRILSREIVERQSAKGGVLFTVTVEAEFDFVSAKDGSKHTVRTYGEAMDSADKATNKAMSAAYKYAAMQTFCIPTEGDNDADAVTHEVAPRLGSSVVERGSEKAGVGGSIPSLATITRQIREVLDVPPKGFHYVQGYKLSNGWHEASILDYDAQGGALKVSTKLKIGSLLRDAELEHLPVRVDVTMKKDAKDGAYLNKIAFVTDAPVDVDEDRIPF